MSRKRPRLSDDEFEAHANSLLEIEALELYVLKVHLLCEVALKGCLAHRLGITEAELPQLNFDTLARLALVGLRPDVGPLLAQVQLLNSLRNEFAHEIEPASHAAKMRDFVVHGFTGGPWPDSEQEQVIAFQSEINLFLGYLQALGGFTPVIERQSTPARLPRILQREANERDPGEKGGGT